MLAAFVTQNYFVAFLACMSGFAYYAGKHGHKFLPRLALLMCATSSYGFALAAWQDVRGWGNTEPLWFLFTAGLWGIALLTFIWLGKAFVRSSSPLETR